jgi:hypothetical protein
MRVADREKRMKTKAYAQKTFDESLAYLRNHGFDVLDAPGTNTGRVFLKKYGCSAAIEHNNAGEPRIFAYPGILIGGEISKLIDKGYQKFLKTTKTERSATADDLRALHDFTEELKEAMGVVSLYNESLGTVSESYHYDRVKDRENEHRPARPWEKEKKSTKKPA